MLPGYVGGFLPLSVAVSTNCYVPSSFVNMLGLVLPLNPAEYPFAFGQRVRRVPVVCQYASMYESAVFVFGFVCTGSQNQGCEYKQLL